MVAEAFLFENYNWRTTSRRSLTTAFIWVSLATNENLPPNVIKQLTKELKNLDETPPEGIKVGVNDDDFSIIYADIEGPDWNPSLGLRHVLIVVRCLLIEPFPESALNEQAGKMLLENYEEYARHAILYNKSLNQEQFQSRPPP
ncbi:hypothetical protein CsSME_00052988 [Camellia sinensis var. sinensis]